MHSVTNAENNAEKCEPHIVVDKNVLPEDQAAIQSFDKAVRQNPETFVQAINVYHIGHAAVAKMVDFIGVEGPKSRVLETLRVLFDEKVDVEIVFDEDTEKNISQDPDIRRIKEATEKGRNARPITTEEAFTIRRKRLYRYAKAIRDDRANVQPNLELEKAV